WTNVRRYGASLPAGQVTPSPTPFCEDGRPLRMVEEHQRTAALLRFERFAKELAEVLIERHLIVQFADDQGWRFGGCYSDRGLIVNVAVKGMNWFEGTAGDLLENWTPFLIHEFAHEAVKGHLSGSYHAECCRLAGLLARALIEQPYRFELLRGDRCG